MSVPGVTIAFRLDTVLVEPELILVVSQEESDCTLKLIAPPADEIDRGCVTAAAPCTKSSVNDVGEICSCVVTVRETGTFTVGPLEGVKVTVPAYGVVLAVSPEGFSVTMRVLMELVLSEVTLAAIQGWLDCTV